MSRGVDVLHFVPSYHPARGGIEVLVENLVAELRGGQSVDSAVVAPALPDQRSPDYVYGDTRVHSIPVPPAIMAVYEAAAPTPVPVDTSLSILAEMYASLRRIFESTKPRLVHIHSVSMMAPAAAAMATSQGIPVLFHEHGLADVNPANYKQQLRDATWVCAVSKAVADSIRDECSRQALVHVIPNGLEDPLGRIGHREESFPSVAMVGRLAEEKGFDDGLDALGVVRRRFPDVRIRLVGDGPCAARLYEQADRLGLLGSVDYYGKLDREKTLAVIAGSSVVLVPSRRTEGFSLVAAEAALLGRPVVATTTGGLPETVHHEVTGILVPPGDVASLAAGVERLLGSPSLRSALGAKARDRAACDFSVQRFASDIAGLYEAMLGNQRINTGSGIRDEP